MGRKTNERMVKRILQYYPGFEGLSPEIQKRLVKKAISERIIVDPMETSDKLYLHHKTLPEGQEEAIERLINSAEKMEYFKKGLSRFGKLSEEEQKKLTVKALSETQSWIRKDWFRELTDTLFNDNTSDLNNSLRNSGSIKIEGMTEETTDKGNVTFVTFMWDNGENYKEERISIPIDRIPANLLIGKIGKRAFREHYNNVNYSGSEKYMGTEGLRGEDAKQLLKIAIKATAKYKEDTSKVSDNPQSNMRNSIRYSNINYEINPEKGTHKSTLSEKGR